MIPVNAAAQAAVTTATNLERRDNPSHVRVVTPTVTEDEANVEAKREEATRVVKELDEAQYKHRDEERDPSQGHGQQKSSYGSSRGQVADIYV